MLERQEDMKARGLPSPDLDDALAPTFSATVRFTIRASAHNLPRQVLDHWESFDIDHRRPFRR